MRFLLFAFACVGFVLAGCNDSGKEAFHEVKKGARVKDEPHAHDHGHEHGPHGGHLVEMGEDAFHAEVVYDAKAAKIDVYLLDDQVKRSVPIDDKEITLNLTIDGKPKAITAKAAPASDDPKGKASHFEVAGNADVKAHIKDEEDLKGSVTVNYNGKPIKGDIKHEH